MILYKPSASIEVIMQLIRFAEFMSLDVNTIMRNTGLDEYINRNAIRIPKNIFDSLWEQISSMAKDDNFGLHLGAKFIELSRGNLSFNIMLNSPDIISALKKMFKYHNLTIDFLKPGLKIINDTGIIYYKAVSREDKMNRHHSEAVITSLVQSIKGLSDNKIKPFKITFSHKIPGNIEEHKKILGKNIYFGEKKDEIFYKIKDLNYKIFLNNPELLHTLENYADDKLNELYRDNSLTDKISRKITKNIFKGIKINLNDIASEMSMSTRKLQLKLKEAGTTYQNIVDNVRKEIAINYLEKEDSPICEIALLLGYSEQSVFNHAFKRWTGKNPFEYRKMYK